jgi:protein-tyrosine sulfotransferase
MDTYEGIVVLGSPRSGTTLLRRLLNAHPRICCPPETNLLSACARFLHEEPSSQGLQIGVTGGLAFSGIAPARVLESLSALATGFFREIASASGKPRWAEKTAFDVFHIDAIEALLGERCRYICVCRDGLDTVCSIKELCDEMDRYLPELHEYLRVHASPLEAIAHAWVDVNTRLLRFAGDHPSSCCWIRYENVVANPVAELDRLFQFLDEPADAESVLRTAFAGGVSVGLGDWKTYEAGTVSAGSVGRSGQLPPDVFARLSEIVTPTMVRLGYPRPSTSSIPPADEARRRYRAMKMVKQLQARASSES